MTIHRELCRSKLARSSRQGCAVKEDQSANEAPHHQNNHGGDGAVDDAPLASQSREPEERVLPTSKNTIATIAPKVASLHST